VPEALRGRGRGAALVRAVAAAAAAAGAPALWLYSDIGAPFYEALGFRAACGGAAFDVLLPPRRAAPGEGNLVAADLSDAVRALASAPAPAAPPGGCALRLERARAEWLLAGERLRAGAGGFCGVAPLPCGGARCGRAVALWRVAHAPRGARAELLVLALRGRGEEAAAVLRRAQAVAAEAGLAGVRLWDAEGVGAESLAAGGVRAPREGKLPMVLPLAPGDARSALHTHAVIERGCWY
jgi:hypothetical protein